MKTLAQLLPNVDLKGKDATKPFAQKEMRCHSHSTFVSKQWWDGSSWTKCPACLAEEIGRDRLLEEERAKEDKLRRFHERLTMANIPKLFQDRTLENFEVFGGSAREMQAALDTATQYAMNFEHNLLLGANLIFMGKTGTGKNHLACAIANYILSHMRYRALMVTQEGIVNAIMDSFGQEQRTTVKDFVEPELLIIDEFGAGRDTAFADSTLFQVIDGRYVALRPTIFLTNCDHEQLEARMGDRIISRLRDTTREPKVVLMRHDDYRLMDRPKSGHLLF